MERWWIQSPELSTTRSSSCRYSQSSHQCLLWLGFEWWGHWNRNKPLWKEKKIFFPWSFSPPKAESHDRAAAGPHSQHRPCCSQREAHRQVNRILGCTLHSPSQIIIGKQRSRRHWRAGQVFGETCRRKSRYWPCIDIGRALVHKTEKEDDTRDDKDDATSPMAAIH